MKKLIALAALASLAVPALAAPSNAEDDGVAKAGGIVYEPGVGKGFVAVVNAQAKAPASEVKNALMAVFRESPYSVKIVKSDAEAKGAGLTIRLIDDGKKPPMLAAPEEFWAELNVAKLGGDKTLVPRLRKMSLRAIAYAAGAGGSSFAGNLLDTTSVEEVDPIGEFLPVDALDRIQRHLEKRGLEPLRAVPYSFACEEGWAPAPTNDIQKAIYEEIKNPEKRWDKDFGGDKKKK